MTLRGHGRIQLEFCHHERLGSAQGFGHRLGEQEHDLVNLDGRRGDAAGDVNERHLDWVSLLLALENANQTKGVLSRRAKDV